MANHGAHVNTIGHGKVSEAEKAKRRRYREVVIAIGMMPLGFTYEPGISENKKLKRD